MKIITKSITRVLPFALALGLSFATSGTGPDSQINPLTGDIETVDAVLSDGNADVRYTIDEGAGQPEASRILSTSLLPDLEGRIAIGPEGTTWVVWWQDDETDRVILRRHTLSGGWSGEHLVSDPAESSSRPEIAHDGTSPHVAYVVDEGDERAVAVNSSVGPDPWPGRTIVHRTSRSGELDVRIHARGGKLWVTWLDVTRTVGWSEYDYGTESWSPAGFEPYENDPGTALRRISQEVLD
jgi:hypothetical protein